MLAEVIVELSRGERDQLALALVPKQPRAAGERKEISNATRKSPAADRAPNEFPVLGAKAELHLVSIHIGMPLRQRRDAVCARAARVTIRPDAKPSLVHEPDRQRADPVALVRLATQVASGRSRTPASDSASRDAELTPAFTILAPRVQEAPVVFCSPHSGRVYPASFLAASRLDPHTLRKSEDCYVDELFAGVRTWACR